jgi:fucose permease
MILISPFTEKKMYVYFVIIYTQSISALKQGKIYFVETIFKSSKNAIKLSFYSIFNRLPDKPQNLTNESIIFNLPFVHRNNKSQNQDNDESILGW